MENETPRTDEITFKAGSISPTNEVVPAAFARDLEKRLNTFADIERREALLLAEVVRLSDAMREREWQPMETAPRDGTMFIGYWPHEASVYIMEIVWWGWGPGALANKIWMSDNGPCEPTHWMPLPAAPETKKEQG